MPDVCGPGGIPGNPEVIRDAARGLESNADLGEEILDSIRSARATVLSGWSALSAEGFEAFVTAAQLCAASLVKAGHAAARVLHTYAEELEAAQHAFAHAEAKVDSARDDIRSAETDKAESRAEKASTEPSRT